MIFFVRDSVNCKKNAESSVKTQNLNMDCHENSLRSFSRNDGKSR
ncbi:hypothetical protein [Helicobacter sp. 23-1045]